MHAVRKTASQFIGLGSGRRAIQSSTDEQHRDFALNFGAKFCAGIKRTDGFAEFLLAPARIADDGLFGFACDLCATFGGDVARTTKRHRRRIAAETIERVVQPFGATFERSVIAATQCIKLRRNAGTDGRWLATQESEGGAWRLFLRPFPNVDDARIPVATDNLSLRPPVWSRNGQELFYATGDRLMSVTVGGGNPPALGKPALVLDLADSNGGFGYATPESRERVLVSRSIGRSAGAPVEYRVVLNWFTELNARMPQ